MPLQSKPDESSRKGAVDLKVYRPVAIASATSIEQGNRRPNRRRSQSERKARMLEIREHRPEDHHWALGEISRTVTLMVVSYPSSFADVSGSVDIVIGKVLTQETGKSRYVRLTID